MKWFSRISIRKIGLKPTRYGFLFIMLLVGMLIGSVNYNNNLGFLLTFLLGSMGLVSIIHSIYNVIDIEVMSVSSHPVFAGQQIEFVIKVKAGRRPKYGIMLETISHGHTHEYTLNANQLMELRVQATCPYRGIFKPGKIAAVSIYPLGLFKTWSYLEATLEQIVYPEPVKSDFQPTLVAMAGSETQGVKAAGTEDFEGLQNYQPGDSLSRVSWKAFSKGQGVFVKGFTGYRQAAVLVDWDRLTGTDIENRLSILCGMVLRLHAAGLEYGLKLPGTLLAPDYSETHKHICLKALALYSVQG